VDFGYFGPLYDPQTHTARGDPEKRDFAFASTPFNFPEKFR